MSTGRGKRTGSRKDWQQKQDRMQKGRKQKGQEMERTESKQDRKCKGQEEKKSQEVERTGSGNTEELRVPSSKWILPITMDTPCNYGYLL